MGPNARAGIKFKAPTINTTAINQEIKSGEVVESVPAPEGTFFLLARDPASARVGMANQIATHQHGDGARQIIKRGIAG